MNRRMRKTPSLRRKKVGRRINQLASLSLFLFLTDIILTSISHISHKKQYVYSQKNHFFN